MAPSKRRRLLTDDEGRDSSPSEASDYYVPTSQNHNSKRSRIALAAENGGSVVSDDSDLDDSPGDDKEGQDGAPANEESAEDAIMQEMRKSENFKSWLDVNRPNQPAEYGIIEEIYCQNFMCHEKLRITLGPLINFVIGHNGSGKSAVLTALVLCLGVKATATNRGASLKNFIKAGTDVAVLRVKIKNKGELAYQPDIYGDSIIVERTFTRAGTSGFKIQSEQGRTITTKKSALEDMLDYLGLQLDNPLNVLTQDLARQFLSNSTPNEKYKFFLKGTQLEQLDTDYRLMYDYIDQTEAQIHARAEDMTILKQRMETAERKKRLMDEAGTIRDKIQQFSWMHAWAQVEEVEQTLEKEKADIAKIEADLDTKRQTANAKSSDFAAKNTRVDAMKGVEDDMKAEVKASTERYEKVKEEFDGHKAMLMENTTQLRHINQDIHSAKKEVEKQRARLEEQTNIESSSGPAQTRITAELREAEIDSEQCKIQFDNADRQPLEQAKAEAEDAVTAAKRALQPAQRAVDDAESRLSSLQKSKGDQMKGFNQNMPNLLRAINNETKFRQKPVGPLGMHVKLLKPEWSSVVESTFGGVLEAFVVTNSHDQSILRGLQQRCNCHGDIYIGDPRPIDVSQNSADPSQDTLLRILDIENDLIRNQFIINQAAEQTVLIKDRQEAYDYMYAATRPYNTKAVLCMHGTVRGEGHRFNYTAYGQRMDRVKPWPKPPRMKTDIDAQIQNQKDMVNDAVRRLETEQQAVRQREQEVRKAADSIKRFEQEKRRLRIAWQEADGRINDLQTELDKFTVDAGAMHAIREALREAQETEAQHRRSYTDAVEEKERVNDLQKDVKKRLDAATAEVADAEMKLKKLETTAGKLVQARETALREKNLAFSQVEAAEKAKADAEASKGATEERIQEFIGLASTICARVPVDEGMTPDMIDKRIDTLANEQKTAEQNIGGTLEQIMEEYHKTRNEWRTAKAELVGLEKVTKVLKKSYVQRNERWMEFRRHIMAKAKIMFSLLLNERAFKGQLISDHKKRELDISVEPDATLLSDKGRQAKTLSGGEKSFSTICLLLSIWEAMGSAIRCLDEFDVFMDNVNRDRSMRMMIQAARRATGKQYILITPQAMGNVDVDRDVKVIKYVRSRQTLKGKTLTKTRMSDPERGQTSLAF